MQFLKQPKASSQTFAYKIGGLGTLRGSQYSGGRESPCNESMFSDRSKHSNLSFQHMFSPRMK